MEKAGRDRIDRKKGARGEQGEVFDHLVGRAAVITVVPLQ